MTIELLRKLYFEEIFTLINNQEARIAELEARVSEERHIASIHRKEIDTVTDMLGLPRTTTLDEIVDRLSDLHQPKENER